MSAGSKKSGSKPAGPATGGSSKNQTGRAASTNQPAKATGSAKKKTAVKETMSASKPKPAAGEPTADGSGPSEPVTVGATIGRVVAAVQPENLPVRDGEDPWTADELAEVQSELESELGRLAEQVEVSETELVGLLRDSSEGAGRDSADVGSTNFERDHEISLANNARDLLDQTRLALRHLGSGSYGLCDSCGRPIGKPRLQAFPRATLCMECKQREERR
jgi:DnaK suppressor protein